jgi:hypothetical protein
MIDRRSAHTQFVLAKCADIEEGVVQSEPQ